MPDAPAAAPPAAPPSSAPPAPSVTFGGGKPAAAPPVEAPKPAAGAPPADDGLKFDFGFGEETPAEIPAGEEIDYSQPFDPELKKLLEADPDRLKAAERSYYENRNWKSTGFKNAQEAKQYRGEVDTLATALGRTDGKKGLDALKAEASEWHQMETAWRAADPAIIKQFGDFLDGPAMDKATATWLGHYREKNPQGWSHQMAQMFMGELRAQNAQGLSVLNNLNRLVEIANGLKNPELSTLLRSISERLNEINDISQQTPEAAPAASAKDADLAKREKGLFTKELSMQVMPQIHGAAEKAAKVVLGNRQLKPEALKSFSDKIAKEYSRLAKLDADFQANAKALLDQKDIEGFERLTRSSIQRIMPRAARNINREYQDFTGGEQRRAEAESRVESAAGGSSASGQLLRFTGKMSPNGGPDPSVIDWQAMRAKSGGRSQAEEMLFNHQFMVKGDAKNVYFW